MSDREKLLEEARARWVQNDIARYTCMRGGEVERHDFSLCPCTALDFAVDLAAEKMKQARRDALLEAANDVEEEGKNWAALTGDPFQARAAQCNVIARRLRARAEEE